MKTAEEWRAILFQMSPDSNFIDLISQIQLDAWKQGMTDAAMAIAGGTNQDSNAILSLRDKRKEI